MSEQHSIAYQNKDIASKYLAESLKNKTFAVYGVDVPRIVNVLPTNLPIIEANELRLDNLFELEDGSLALVDYESTYADVDKIKYLNYIVRTLKRNMDKGKMFRKIRMIVIYTADIEPEETRPHMDVGCLRFSLQEAFLTKMDSEKMKSKLREKVQKGESLTEEEQMEFMILPLTYKGQGKKEECIEDCFEMAKKMWDTKVQMFVLSGMLVFADKVIAEKESKKIREWLKMTKVGQLIEEEKMEAIKDAVKKSEEGFAIKLLKRGDDIAEIVPLFDELSAEDIEKLAEMIEK